jgi:hypothetical protein
VFTPYEKYTAEYANAFYDSFKKVHEKHDTILTNDYDDEFDYITDGWQTVEYIGYGSYKCENKGKPYRMLSEDEIKEISQIASAAYLGGDAQCSNNVDQ